MILSQKLVTGPPWVARGVAVQPVIILMFYYWGTVGRMNTGSPLVLSAAFKTLTFYSGETTLYIFHAPLTPKSPWHGSHSTENTCHPWISGLLRTSYNDLLNHISAADAFTAIPSWRYYLIYRVHCRAWQTTKLSILIAHYVQVLSLFFLSIYPRVLCYWADT